MAVVLKDLLLSLNELRFDALVEGVGARAFVTRQAPPLRRVQELLEWAAESTAQEKRLADALAPERAAWPDDVLQRWRSWATARLGELPILGLQGSVCMPMDLRDAFVPLALSERHAALDERRGSDTGNIKRGSLSEAIADAEGAGVATLRGLVLVGLPGSGKTTLLKHAWGVVADRGAEALGFKDPDLVPVFLRVAWCDPTDKAHTFLPATLRRGLDEQGYGAAAEPLLGRKLLWLLDGLDEAGSLEQRQKLAKRLGEALTHRPGDRFLLTSRSAGWRDVEGLLDGRLLAWEVQPLAKEQIQPFIQRWEEAAYAALEGKGHSKEEIQAGATRIAEDLARKVLSSAWLADSRRERMVRNPLLLSVLCVVHRLYRQLPERRAALYDHVLTTMLEQLRRTDAFGDAGERVRHRGLPYKEGLRLLGAVAWEAHDQGGDTDVREFSASEAMGWMKPVLDRLVWPEPEAPDLADILRRAEEDCGLLQGTAPGRYQFAHLTFQEHLAAKHAAAEEGYAKKLAARAGQDRWEEPIRLAMSTERLPVELLRAILRDGAAPWDRPRFVTLMADCAREADPTPFSEALGSCADALCAGSLLGMPDGWAAWLTGRMTKAAAEVLAVRVLSLFQGRAAPVAIQGPTARIAGSAQDGAAQRSARTLLGRPQDDRPVMAKGAEPAPGDVRTLLLPGGASLALVWVPGGYLWMGGSAKKGNQNYDPEAHGDDGPVRKVLLNTGFWMGQHPITNTTYRIFVRETGHRESDTWGRDGFSEDNLPVTGVDWGDARAFCAWLSKAAGVSADLPTEAQWERAARGDDARRYPWGDQAPTPERAVFGGQPMAAVGGRPTGVGPYGVHDLTGNVWEWCCDSWSDHHPAASGIDIDPGHVSTEDNAAFRVARGGSWGGSPRGLRAAFRYRWPPSLRFGHLGFRICVLPDRT